MADLKLELFQVEETSQDPYEIGKVAGSERVYDPAGGGEEDFLPISLGEIEKAFEIEKGVRRVGNVSLKTEGLAEDYFEFYTSMFETPWIFAATESASGDPVFVGVVDPDSAEYDMRTSQTSFEAFSFDYVLGQKEYPARLEFETELAGEYSTAEDGREVELFLNPGVLADSAQDLSDIAEPGAIISFDTSRSEHRSVITSNRVDGDRLFVTMEGRPAALSKEVTITVDDRDEVSGWYNPWNEWQYNMRIEDEELFRAVKSAAGTEARFVLGSGSAAKELNPRQDELSRNKDEGRAITTKPWKEIEEGGEDGKTVYIFMELDDADYPGDGTYTTKIEAPVTADSGNGATVLGKTMYGYGDDLSPSEGFDPKGVIAGMFTVKDIQAIGEMFGSVSYYQPPEDEWELSRVVQLPEKPVEALTVIGNTLDAGFLVDGRIASDGLPRFDVEIVPRTQTQTSYDNPIPVSLVKEWTEKPAKRDPQPVVVNMNEDYANTDKYEDVVGFYYKGLDSKDPAVTSKPEDAVEFDVAVEPSMRGTQYAGRVLNDDKLRPIAENIYEFYAGLKRKGETTIDGIQPGVLARYIQVDEVSDGRTMFVTSLTVNRKEKTTKIEGRIGTYGPVAASALNAVVEGNLSPTAPEGSSTVELELSGSGSYSVGLARITSYEWTDGSGALVSESQTLIEDLSPGTYERTLTVTDAAGRTDSQTVTVEPRTESVESEPTPESRPFVQASQRKGTESGTRYGYVRVEETAGDTQPPSEVHARSASGRPLEDSDATAQLTKQTFSDGSEGWEAKVEIDPKRASFIEVVARRGSGAKGDPYRKEFTFPAQESAGFKTQQLNVGSDGAASAYFEVGPDAALLRHRHRSGTDPSAESWSAWTEIDTSGTTTSTETDFGGLTLADGESIEVEAEVYNSQDTTVEPENVWSRTKPYAAGKSDDEIADTSIDTLRGGTNVTIDKDKSANTATINASGDGGGGGGGGDSSVMAQGTATILAGNKRVTVNHGLSDFTTALQNVQVSPQTTLDSANIWKLENATTDSFDIALKNAANVDLDFSWQVASGNVAAIEIESRGKLYRTFGVRIEPRPELRYPSSFLATRNADDTVDLNWETFANAARYGIYRARKKGGPYGVITTQAQSPPYTDNPPSGQKGIDHYYVSTSFDSEGIESGFSPEQKIDFPIEPGYVLVEDTFTDDNGVTLVNHTPDIDREGSGWKENTSNWIIDNNEVYCDADEALVYIETEVKQEIIVEMDWLPEGSANERNTIFVEFSTVDGYNNTHRGVKVLADQNEVHLINGDNPNSAFYYDFTAGVKYHIELLQRGKVTEAWIDGEYIGGEIFVINNEYYNCGIKRNDGGDITRIDDFKVTTTDKRVRACMGVDTPENPVLGEGRPDFTVGGQRINRFEFYYREVSNNSNGGGIRMYNSNGNVELGLATDNPDWVADGANGPNVFYGGDGYERWVRAEAVFDWSAGTATVTFKDQQSGYSESITVDLKQGIDFEYFKIEDYSAGGGWAGGTKLIMWFDSIRVVGPNRDKLYDFADGTRQGIEPVSDDFRLKTDPNGIVYWT